MVRKMYQSYLNENDNFEKGKPIMHGYIISHGGDLNETDNFNLWKLIIHGYKHLHGNIFILTKMKIMKSKKYMFFS